jgi:hypothetical protein
MLKEIQLLKKRGNKHAEMIFKTQQSCEALPLHKINNLTHSAVLNSLNSHSMEQTLKIPANKISFN